MPLSSHDPVYRHILADAFRSALRNVRAWPLAFFAGIFLTGSVSDLLWKMMNLGVEEGRGLFPSLSGLWSNAMTVWPSLRLTDLILGSLQVLQGTALLLILTAAVFGFSVICQGAIVFIIGTSSPEGKRGRIREALTVGARAFWPVCVLNILILAGLWAVRMLVAALLLVAVQAGTAMTFLAYVIAFVAFVLVAAAAIVIQVLAVNAMILQGATLSKALERAAHLLHHHWIIATEIAVILFGIALGGAMLVVAINAVISIPVFILITTAAIIQSPALLHFLLGTTVTVFILSVLLVGALQIMLQYATWTLLYQRLGEGGALPKIHRWIRQVTRRYSVPGS
ncbi:MAG: hypothetical protein RL141_543 [Candidatus Parcubacteria bacterium]|jgi:hypothetical protein